MLVLVAALFQDSAERGIGVQGKRADLSGLEGTYGRRHALVVGIDAYADAAFPDLTYAVADARAVAKLLVESYGFAPDDVRLLLDSGATRAALERALEDWACDRGRVAADDLFLVFFAGHGITRDLGARGNRGYLIPVDGTSERDGAPRWSSLIGMNDMEDVSEAMPAKHALFLLDCCFGGLAVTRAAPPIAAGLTSRARQIISAGTAEQTVLDTGVGGHSVFTGALLGGLSGDADLDRDGVVSFGELYNHVGHEVERRTEERQTPLQGYFPDHEGGNVALFPPGHVPSHMSAADRLKRLERTAEQRLIELERLADYVLLLKLEELADALWPQIPEMVPRYRDWLSRARELVAHRPLHEEALRRVRQETYLSQVVAGLVVEREGTEPDWDRAEPQQQWRYETLFDLLASLDRMIRLIEEVEARLEGVAWIAERTIESREAQWSWAGAIESIASPERCPMYGGLELSPQMGLVPIGRDPLSGLWEFAHAQTGEIAQRDPETGGLVMREETGLVFVLIPEGSFLMGAQRTDADGSNHDPRAQDDEGPVHEVEISPFFLSKYEMTQGQWSRFRFENPASWNPEKVPDELNLSHPVESVSWVDCAETVLRLGLEIPSEAQWEYACRAGTVSVFSWPANAAMENYANLADENYRETWIDVRYWEDVDDGFVFHAPVGSLLPNPFGLHDVHGNVWEWCRDGYDPEFYARSPARDPLCKPDAHSHVFRGGSFDGHAAYARSAERAPVTPEDRDFALGLRPARAIED